jgi:hypothetical protein
VQALSFPAVFASVLLRVQNIVEATAAEELLVVRRQYLYFCTSKYSLHQILRGAARGNALSASVFVLLY